MSTSGPSRPNPALVERDKKLSYSRDSARWRSLRRLMSFKVTDFDSNFLLLRKGTSVCLTHLVGVNIETQ